MVATAPIQDLTFTFTTSPHSQPEEQLPNPASSLPLQNKPVSNIEFGSFFCLLIIIKQRYLYKDIHCLQMHENGIYRMPKQVRHVTPLEFQLCCLDPFPISLEPPEAPKA